MRDEFSEGLLVGLLVGEGHFGGDGRQPHVTLRMHVRHRAIFLWLQRLLPGARLYGPYNHGGREYYQWMVRGRTLRDELLPILERRLSPRIDGSSYERFTEMKRRYASRLKSEVRIEESAAPSDVSEPSSVVDAIFTHLRQNEPDSSSGFSEEP